jgi:hypothetical protein
MSGEQSPHIEIDDGEAQIIATLTPRDPTADQDNPFANVSIRNPLLVPKSPINPERKKKRKEKND